MNPSIDPLLAQATALADLDPVANAVAISALTELAKELRLQRVEAERNARSEFPPLPEGSPPIPRRGGRKVEKPKAPAMGKAAMLAAMESAYASGSRSVTFGGKIMTYGSRDAMAAALQEMRLFCGHNDWT